MPKTEEQIDPQIFEHLVRLAALELEDEEGEYLRRELNNQLAAVHELEAIQLDDQVAPAAHGVPYPPERKQALRPDSHVPCENSAEIISQAPQIEDGCIIVPDIPHTTLE